MMHKKLSTFVRLGPLQGPLAAITWLSGSTAFEKMVLTGLGRAFVRSRYGVLMKSNWSDGTFDQCFFKRYGTTLSDLLAAEKRPFVFLDIGANQGLYSLLAGQNPHCRAAIAFEPVPATFALLEANIGANGLDHLVRPVNRAIAAEPGETAIRMNPVHSGGASMAASNALTGQEIVIHSIDHDGLDDLIPAGSEPILVKIDVEGFEPVVVQQLVQSRHIGRMTMLFYEIDEKWVDPAAIERTLRSVGFSTFRKIAADPSRKHYDVLATR